MKNSRHDQKNSFFTHNMHYIMLRGTFVVRINAHKNSHTKIPSLVVVVGVVVVGRNKHKTPDRISAGLIIHLLNKFKQRSLSVELVNDPPKR